jgi:hypothetical protein
MASDQKINILSTHAQNCDFDGDCCTVLYDIDTSINSELTTRDGDSSPIEKSFLLPNCDHITKEYHPYWCYYEPDELYSDLPELISEN